MQEPSSGPVRGLRPRRSLKPKHRGTSDDDFVSPKRGTHHHSSRGRRKARTAGSRGRGRGRGSGRGRGRRIASSGVVYDDHESDEDDEDAVSLRSEEDDFVEERLSDDDEEDDDEEEAAINDESDYLEELVEEDEDDASYCTESSHGSAAGMHTHLTRHRSACCDGSCGLENGRSAYDLSLLTETLKMDPGAFLCWRRPRV